MQMGTLPSLLAEWLVKLGWLLEVPGGESRQSQTHARSCHSSLAPSILSSLCVLPEPSIMQGSHVPFTDVSPHNLEECTGLAAGCSLSLVLNSGRQCPIPGLSYCKLGLVTVACSDF